MKYMKLVVLSAMALMAFASTASATTLEINGVTQNSSVTITSSLSSGTSAILKDTGGFSQNTCTTSSVNGKTTKFTGPVTGTTESLTFANCERTVTVHAPGSLEVETIKNTTNGTVYAENAQVTTGSPFGTLNCETGPTKHIGTLTGVGTGGHATLHANANLTCSGLSTKWEATYVITSPTGLGVSG